MLNKLIYFSLHQRAIVLVAAVVLLVFGDTSRNGDGNLKGYGGAANDHSHRRQGNTDGDV